MLSFNQSKLSTSNTHISSIASFTFAGNVTIRFNLLEGAKETNRFYFFSRLSEITSYTLTESGKEVATNPISIDDTTTLGYVGTKNPLQLKKDYELKFIYTGIIQRQGSDGLFENSYNDGGEKRYLLGTQFEAFSARDMFPCADDPHFKSVVNLTVIYPKGAKIFSNSDPEKEEDYE